MARIEIYFIVFFVLAEAALSAGSRHGRGKDGRDAKGRGEDGEDGNDADGEDGRGADGADGKDGRGADGADGKDGRGADGADGKDGRGADGADNNSRSASGKMIKTPKKKKDSDESTSSSSGRIRTENSGDSLAESISSSSKTEDDKYRPKSSKERKGWRIWHRKCKNCPEAKKKWRDPSIPWICGGYQRARRSFKSKCMMEYRNCQDGTMFVKLHDYRCSNESSQEQFPHGAHFFYEYRVELTQESSDSSRTFSSEESLSSSTDY